MIARRTLVLAVPAGIVAAKLAATARAAEVSPAETAAIAEEAFLYAFPMVMNYGTVFEFSIDKASSQFKAPFNSLFSEARVFTPKDTAVVSPNSDTPYSFVGIDLRAEPFVFCNPAIEKARYFSVQLVDMYTFNFGYIGSRTTGNGPGCFMIAGPGWSAETPPGISKVFRCETEFALAIVRTQLFDPGDIENVKKIQAGYRAGPLSKFLNTAAPTAAPEIAWPKIDKQLAQANPFGFLNFVLQFCPPTGAAAVEVPMRERFARIGIEPGKSFPASPLSQEQKAGLEEGVKRALGKIERQVEALGKDENGWRVATNSFGDREMIAGDWTRRAAAAMAGIYGNDAAEALYPLLATDSEGQKPDGSKHRYTLTFSPGELPPANAFWSVTMYDGRTRLLVANPIDRYLINSPMLPSLRKNADGSITLYVQKDSPGAEREPNWLPAPDGPIYLVLRLYWPKEAAMNGTWKPPPMQRVT